MIEKRMVNKEDLPKISVVMPTLNSQETLEKALKSIRDQDYPREKIEILVLDGGSTDQSESISKKYDARFIAKPALRDNQEGRRAVGVHESTGDLIASIDSDNILMACDWFRRMVRPFIDDAEIVATQPLWYFHQKNDNSLNRYFSLFGVNDPVPYYLNKRDRLTHFESKWELKGHAEDKGDYYSVVFSEEDLPTIGCNGYIVRKKIIEKAKCNEKEYFHIDVNVDLIRLGFNKFAFVKTDILHLTGATFSKLILKRLRYMQNFYQNDGNLRRYHLVTRRDLLPLARFIFYSISAVEPICQSTRGFLKKKDWAWFLHLPMCQVMVVIYGYAVIRRSILERIGRA